MISKLMNRVLSVVRDEQGIETLEWIAMAFVIIVSFAVLVYPGGLVGAVNTTIANIVAAL